MPLPQGWQPVTSSHPEMISLRSCGPSLGCRQRLIVPLVSEFQTITLQSRQLPAAPGDLPVWIPSPHPPAKWGKSDQQSGDFGIHREPDAFVVEALGAGHPIFSKICFLFLKKSTFHAAATTVGKERLEVLKRWVDKAKELTES